MELSLLREEEKQTFKRQDENSVSCVKEIYNRWKHFFGRDNAWLFQLNLLSEAQAQRRKILEI